MLYFHHDSSREHDPSVPAPEHPDAPARVEAIEAKLDAAGWPGCEKRSAPAAQSFAQMACQVRDLARAAGAPVGAVLEGGYDPTALADSVLATIRALDGEGEAESIAPDPLITSRVAAHVGHFWTL